MRPWTILPLVGLVAGCVAIAEGTREESAARAPVILPPMEEGLHDAPLRTERRTTTLSQVPVRPGHVWVGQYVCTGDPIGFRVRIERTEGTSVWAVVELPAGHYEASGQYDPDSGALELQPTEGQVPAAGVARIGLYGTIAEDGALYEGRVTDPSCRWFTLRH